jgi:hypothetical protein
VNRAGGNWERSWKASETCHVARHPNVCARVHCPAFTQPGPHVQVLEHMGRIVLQHVRRIVLEYVGYMLPPIRRIVLKHTRMYRVIPH